MGRITITGSIVSLGAKTLGLALLALAGNGCFLFDKPSPPATEEAPAAPPCNPPEATDAAPAGISVLSLAMLEDEGLVGRTVYSLSQVSESGVWVDVGQPLSICTVHSIETTTTSAEGERYTVKYPTSATVMTASGKSLKFPVTNLSSTPPLFSMANPGKAEDLIKHAFAHAYQIQMQRYEINKNYTDERLESDRKVGGVWEVNWDYHVERGLENAGMSANSEMSTLVFGKLTRRSLLSQQRYAWIAGAEDDRILEWHADGSQGEPDGKVYEAMNICVQNLDTVNSSFRRIGNVEKARREKAWRKGLEGASESKLAQLDATEEKRINQQKADAQSFIDRHLDSKNCQLAREFVGIAAP